LLLSRYAFVAPQFIQVWQGARVLTVCMCVRSIDEHEYCTSHSHRIAPVSLDAQLRLQNRLWKSRWPRPSRLKWTKSTGTYAAARDIRLAPGQVLCRHD
jgi:hypothetical protein